MKYDVETIRELVKKNPATHILYFWGHTPNPKKMTAACFSQWYDCCFEVNGIQYHTAEQYMMASKAKLFGDNEVCQEIIMAYHPLDYKKLGRKVHNFEPSLWDSKKSEIAVEGNKAKFSQNPDLKDSLLSTGDAILVEASPFDKIWGIGFDRETALKGTVNDWQGENLLGCALMEVRDWLKDIEQ